MKKEEKELLNEVEKAAYQYEQKYTGCAQCVFFGVGNKLPRSKLTG